MICMQISNTLYLLTLYTLVYTGIFTITALTSCMFLLGGAASSAVFISCVVSYITVCGMGLFQDFIMKGMKAKAKAAGAGVEDSNQEMTTSEIGQSTSSRTVVMNPLLEKAQSGNVEIEDTTTN